MEKENEIPEEDITKKDETEVVEENTMQDKNIEVNKENDMEIIEKDEKNQDEKNEIKEEGKSKNKKVTSGKKSKKFLLLIAFLVVIILFISTIFAIINMNNNNIIRGVYIENVDISNLSKQEVAELVNSKIEKIENVEVYCGEYSEVIKLDDLGIEVVGKDAIQAALAIGKSNNILIDNFNILKANIFKTKLQLNISVDEQKFKEMTKNIQAEIPGAIKEYSYEIKSDELVISNGIEGRTINGELFKNLVINNIKEQFNTNQISIEIPVENTEPQKIDIEKIYKEIYKEAKDAYIVEGEDEEIVELHKEENGIDFKISIEEARQIVSEDKQTYNIPLKITKPKVEVKDLGDKLFKQTLAKYTTIYDAGNLNRSHNIALAAKTINGTILLPGETFSYNGILGNTNKEKGYKVGTAYVGGKVVDSDGGGICQVSSTLYNAVLYANLEIVERYNHSYVVNYVPAGRDATVAYGGKDFKFKNTRNYPIKIVSSAKNGVVSITIKGIKEEKEYEVVLTSTVLSTTPNKTVYENNSSLAKGTEKVIQKGYTGKKSIAYKILKYNGKTISKTVLSKDTYKPMDRIVQVGTKNVSTTTSTVTQPVTPNVSTTPTTNISINSEDNSVTT